MTFVIKMFFKKFALFSQLFIQFSKTKKKLKTELLLPDSNPYFLIHSAARFKAECT